MKKTKAMKKAKEVLQFRIAHPLYADLKRSADRKGISISEEVEFRIKDWKRCEDFRETWKHFFWIADTLKDRITDLTLLLERPAKNRAQGAKNRREARR